MADFAMAASQNGVTEFKKMSHTDKKILIYKEIQSGAVGKSYMRKAFLIYEETLKYLVIYEEAVSHV
jgi:hypothetical protein